jgi:hypothetical protein
MSFDNTTLTANPERGEVLLTIAGQPRLIRFGLRFLKSLTDRAGHDGPSDLLERLGREPLAALIDMAAVGIALCVPAAELPADFDALQALDELSNDEQQALFTVLRNAVTASPIMAALNPSKVA